MNKLATFQEQARVLRTLAATFEIPAIREQLLALAEKCEALAASLQEAAPDASRE
jgi:hypothetical protein